MNKNYFGWLLKNYRISALFFLILFAGISAIPLIPGSDVISSYSLSIGIMTVFTLLMTFLLPVLLFAFVHRRRSADQFFALPISRTKQLITILLFCFTMIFGIFALTALGLWLIYAARFVLFTKVLGAIAMAALMIAVMLIINTAFYLFANNVFDGIVMIGAYTCIPLLVLGVIESFSMNMVAGENIFAVSGIPMWFSPLAMCWHNLSALLSPYSYAEDQFYWLYAIAAVLWALAGCAALYWHFIKRKTERAEQLSDHPMAYPLIINLYAVMIVTAIAFGYVIDYAIGYITLYLLILFAYVAAQFIYRRKIRLTPKIFAAYALITVLALGCAYAAKATDGFNLSQKYTYKTGDLLIFRYEAAVRPDRIDQPVSYDSGEEYVTIYADAEIPVNEIDRNPELTGLLEKLRQEGIRNFYQGKNDSGAQIYFHNSYRNESVLRNTYFYRLSGPASIEDLKMIDDSVYGTVTVQVYDEYEVKEYSLNEYMGKEGE